MAAEGFEKLVKDLYAPLYRFAFSLTKNESDAADLTQQAFYIWATKGQQLRDTAKAKTWLFTSLYREYLNTRRKQARFVGWDGRIEETPAALSPSLTNQLDGATVQKALLALDENFRAPLALFYLQEHSYREIAEILDIPIGTVMSRICRGKAELREILDAKSKDGAGPSAGRSAR